MSYKHAIYFLICFFFSTTVFAVKEGQKLPVCPLNNMENGELIQLEKYKGNVILLDFWASWCPPCAKSVPFLNELHANYSAKGLKIIGVNLDEDLDDAKGFLARFPAKFDQLLDQTKQCAEEFNVAAMPSSYIIDHNGVVRYIHLGFRNSETDKILDNIQQALKLASQQL